MKPAQRARINALTGSTLALFWKMQETKNIRTTFPSHSKYQVVAKLIDYYKALHKTRYKKESDIEELEADQVICHMRHVAQSSDANIPFLFKE